MKKISLFIYAVFVFGILVIAFAAPVSAQTTQQKPVCPPNQVSRSFPGGVGEVCCPQGATGSAEECVTAKYLNPIIKVVAALAGVAVVGGLIWGGIQYGSSAGDPQKVTKAKKSIVRALTGLVAFMLLGSFLQFMSPVSIDGSTANCNTSFLGLKAWYAYVPDQYIDAKSCKVSDDLPILPVDRNNPGVLAPIALAIIDNLLRIAALVAVAFVVVGGARYITSQGQPNDTKLALSSIINALIGLAIAMFAAIIVSFLGGALFK